MDEREVIELDAETEDLAKLLTLMFKETNSLIDLGETYEHVLRMIVQLTIEGGVSEEEAIQYGRKILKTCEPSSKRKVKH